MVPAGDPHLRCSPAQHGWDGMAATSHALRCTAGPPIWFHTPSRGSLTLWVLPQRPPGNGTTAALNNTQHGSGRHGRGKGRGLCGLQGPSGLAGTASARRWGPETPRTAPSQSGLSSRAGRRPVRAGPPKAPPSRTCTATTHGLRFPARRHVPPLAPKARPRCCSRRPGKHRTGTLGVDI